MRKRFFSILIFVIPFFALPVYSDEWDDFADVDRMWDGQKAITNQQFEEVMDVLEEKGNKKEEKKKKKLFKKFGGGSSLHDDLGPEIDIKNTQIPVLAKEDLLVNIPVRLIVEGKPLETGFYKVVAERDKNNKIFISFYQSQFFKGKIEAFETEDDFGEKELNFARLQPFNDSFVRLILGSIDFNAYTYIPYLKTNE